jgi:hypothetical protein
MMKRKLFLLLPLLFAFVDGVAQTTPKAQIQRIRELYAEAKKMVAANGKEGKAPHDMTIELNDGTQVDEDFIINEESELMFYFKKKNEPESYIVDPTSVCYFMTENFEAHGHTHYREWLFDPEKEHLLFVFTRNETDAGYVMESRFYFDEKGKLIEKKYKAGGKDVDEDDEEYDGKSELEQAKKYKEIFDLMVNNEDVKDANRLKFKDVKTAAKADRLKMIKSTYANVKDRVAKNAKSELPRDMRIVVHDQLAEDYPPVTLDLKFYFAPITKGESYENTCYFISKQNSSMYFKEYGEFLLEPGMHKLIFSFTQALEEGETYEWRYYFDENGKCIDTKVKSVDEEDNGDSGVGDKESFSKYMRVFNLVANGD